MRIGYACLSLGVPGTALGKCLLKNADEARLTALTERNLSALERMIDYNLQNGIRLFRISSDVIPFASSPVNRVPWADRYLDWLAAIGRKALAGGMRLSMHPGQYTVLNSPDGQTAENAVRELAYHARFLTGLGLDATHKIILHVGGVYGDKPEAMRRFAERYRALDGAIRARLVLENDDRLYTVRDVLALGSDLGIPVVFDTLHNQANPCGERRDDAEWVALCAKSWTCEDGVPKIHYSQPDSTKRLGAHSQSIGIDAFLRFYGSLGETKPDIMLEVKDKNVSALKCGLCVREPGELGALEREWGRYKYLVLEHSQPVYREIRALLKDKAAYPALPFFRLVEAALRHPVAAGDAINAAEHVWGYVKDSATARQKADFHKALDGYRRGAVPLAALKRRLYRLAEEGAQAYLLEGYYFLEVYGEGTASSVTHPLPE